MGISIAIVSILILASGSLIDVLWSVGIAALYAFYLIIQRFILQTDKLLMLSAHLLIAAVIITPFFVYYNFSIPTDINFWLNILLISLVFTVLPLFLSLYALIGLESSTMGILIYINPIIAFTVAFIVFNEPVNSLQAFAYSLLFVAVVIFNWSFIKAALKIT
ncbi:MAG: EamA family transporter [Pyrinomonadaceae bacterium]|nr:EamA family transporter [Sphingobacteriaceae bacterium]